MAGWGCIGHAGISSGWGSMLQRLLGLIRSRLWHAIIRTGEHLASSAALPPCTAGVYQSAAGITTLRQIHVDICRAIRLQCIPMQSVSRYSAALWPWPMTLDLKSAASFIPGLTINFDFFRAFRNYRVQSGGACACPYTLEVKTFCTNI